MGGVASSPAQIRREACGCLRFWRPGLLAALGAAPSAAGLQLAAGT